MAIVYTIEEQLKYVNQWIRRLTACSQLLTSAKTERENRIRGGDVPTAIAAAINLRGAVVESEIDQLAVDAAAIPFDVFANVVKIGTPAAYTSCDVGAAITGLTANGGTPFAVFTDGDVVELSNCEDSANDGEWAVAGNGGAGGATLLLTGGAGLDANSTDESITVTLKER